MFVKVCGITRREDALHAVRCGATALGFVFWPRSPRFIEADRAAAIIRELPDEVMTVGVFVNQPLEEVERFVAESGVDAVQLHGDEPAAFAEALRRPVVKATPLDGADAVLADWPEPTLVLVDAHDPVRRGGTGVTVDWSGAAQVAARRRIVLAGGLTPENVGAAIAAVRPFGIDVSSGVEQAPGMKDVDRLSRFFEKVREACLDR
jgi:phosphoribosylanthranilate isomerase